MTVSFVRPTPFEQYSEFFKPGKNFVGYTSDNEMISFLVVDDVNMICRVDDIMCVFDPRSWLLISEIAVLCQLNEIIPN